MNQTRTFLIFAWLMVATLLWMAWSKEQAAPVVPGSATAAVSTSTVPGASGVNVPAVPSATAAPGAATMSATPDAAAVSAPTVTVTTDVLRVTLDVGAIHIADLMR